MLSYAKLTCGVYFETDLCTTRTMPRAGRELFPSCFLRVCYAQLCLRVVVILHLFWMCAGICESSLNSLSDASRHRLSHLHKSLICDAQQLVVRVCSSPRR
jgi:hypothetical protein